LRGAINHANGGGAFDTYLDQSSIINTHTKQNKQSMVKQEKMKQRFL
jgi:hypothetical protein